MTQQTSTVEFQVGASLPADSKTYVERKADREFFQQLMAGEFCYVLNSRQMGKSSLRVRTRSLLEKQGVTCATVDLTRIGKSEVTPEKWYAGVVNAISQSCKLNSKFNWIPWWKQRKELTAPVERFQAFVEEILLSHFNGNIVIFIDEIDGVLSQKFKLDDFFGLIRFFYDNRSENSNYKRLTFALLGVASPNDLITDKKNTPFNIGAKIELSGFQFHEATPLVQALTGRVNDPRTVIKEILDWTNGQPFLTQKLCKLIVQSSHDAKSQSIDQVVKTKFIENWEEQDEPQHFRTIRDSIIYNERFAGRLLGLCQVLLTSGKITANGSPEQIQLKLSGIAIEKQKKLFVFNRIYCEIFTSVWIQQSLAKLRPYAPAFDTWVQSGRQDDAQLLRGSQLQEALQWREGKSLSSEDDDFLTKSQEEERKEVERELGVKAEESKILTTANKKGKKIIRRSLTILGVVSIASAGIITITRSNLKSAKREEQLSGEVTQLEQKSISALEKFNSNEVEGLAEALEAGKALEDLSQKYQLDQYPTLTPLTTLQRNVENIKKINQFHGHESKIHQVNFNPSNDLIITASDDDTARVWDLSGAEQLKLLHPHSVQTASFNADGTLIVTTSVDNFTRIWNHRGELIHSIEHPDGVRSAQFSNSQQVIMTYSLNSASIWSLDGEELTRIEFEESIFYAEFSPDGKYFAASLVPTEGQAKLTERTSIWRLDRKKVEEILELPDAYLSINLSSEGSYFLASSLSGSILIGDMKSGDLKYLASSESAPGSLSTLSSQGNFFATTSYILGDGATVNIWRGDQKKYQFTHSTNISNVSFSSDGQFLATASIDGDIHIWNLNHNYISLNSPIDILHADVSHDREFIVTSHANGETAILNLSSQSMVSKLHNSDGTFGARFSPNAQLVLTTSQNNIVCLWDLYGNKLLEIDNYYFPKKIGNRIAEFSSDGEYIIVYDSKENVHVWNLNGEYIDIPRHSDGIVNQILFNPDGSNVLTIHENSKPTLWNSTWDKFKLLDHDDRIYGAISRVNNNLVALASEDELVHLWNFKGQKISTFPYPSKGVKGIKFSPNDKLLLSLGGGKNASIWNTNGEKIATLNHAEMLISANFSNNGKLIATGSIDGTVKVWNKDYQEIAIFDHISEVYDVQFDSNDQQIIVTTPTGIHIRELRSLPELIDKACEYLSIYSANQSSLSSQNTKETCS